MTTQDNFSHPAFVDDCYTVIIRFLLSDYYLSLSMEERRRMNIHPHLLLQRIG